MTAQFAEILLHSDTKMELLSTPLEPFLEIDGVCLNPPLHCSGLRRGYIGTWEIKQNRLYLNQIAFLGTDEDQLTKVFPDATGPVFAYWFSGTLRIPKGELMEKVNYGFLREYEEYLLVNIQSGHVVFESAKKSQK